MPEKPFVRRKGFSDGNQGKKTREDEACEGNPSESRCWPSDCRTLERRQGRFRQGRPQEGRPGREDRQRAQTGAGQARCCSHRGEYCRRRGGRNRARCRLAGRFRDRQGRFEGQGEVAGLHRLPAGQIALFDKPFQPLAGMVRPFCTAGRARPRSSHAATLAKSSKPTRSRAS